MTRFDILIFNFPVYLQILNQTQPQIFNKNLLKRGKD